MRRIAVIGTIITILMGGISFWGLAGFELPAARSALAANTKADRESRLSRWEERRDMQYEKRDKYKDANTPMPTWLRSSIRSICKQITIKKRQLEINPARCDD